MTQKQKPMPTQEEIDALKNALIPLGRTWKERAEKCGIPLRTLTDLKSGKSWTRQTLIIVRILRQQFNV